MWSTVKHPIRPEADFEYYCTSLLAYSLRNISKRLFVPGRIGPLAPFNTAKLTGLSYQKLVKLALAGGDTDDIYLQQTRMQATEIIVLMVTGDPSSALLSSLHKENYFQRSADLMRRYRSVKDIQHLTDPKRPNYDWYDYVAQTWSKILFEDLAIDGDHFRVQAIKAKALPLLEWLSLYANEEQLGRPSIPPIFVIPSKFSH